MIDREVRVSFQIIFGDYELVLPLSLSDLAQERLMLLISDPELSKQRAKFVIQVSESISLILGNPKTPLEENADNPPSSSQVSYALGIARELSLHLPPAVLNDKATMASFLGLYAPIYRGRVKEKRNKNLLAARRF